MNGKGEGRLGCLIALLLLSAFIYFCYQVAPVYLDKIDFEEDLARLTSRAAVDNWSDRVLIRQLVSAAEVRNFQLRREDIQITRSSPFDPTPRLKLSLVYRREVFFLGYPYTFEFRSEASSFIGRL